MTLKPNYTEKSALMSGEDQCAKSTQYGQTITQFKVKLSKDHQDITTCKELADILITQDRTHEAKMVNDIIFNCKQTILQVTMELARSIFIMQEVLSRTPQDQGANALDTFSRRSKTVTTKSARIREKTGRLQNLFIYLGDKKEINNEVCNRLETFRI